MTMESFTDEGMVERAAFFRMGLRCGKKSESPQKSGPSIG
jgi:hypothetical protein